MRRATQERGRLNGESVESLRARPMAYALSVCLGLENLATTIKACWADVMAQMRFTGGRLDRGARGAQGIVSAVHATLGWGLLVLLNSHDYSPGARCRAGRALECAKSQIFRDTVSGAVRSGNADELHT